LQRFTEKAIKVVMLAQEEARRLGHNFVGTEQVRSLPAACRVPPPSMSFGNPPLCLLPRTQECIFSRFTWPSALIPSAYLFDLLPPLRLRRC